MDGHFLSNLPISELRFFTTIGSTNDEALMWAAAGAPDAALVVAEEQTAGRGRLSRKWVTRPGAALAFSLVLRPSADEVERLALVSPLAALAVCRALEDVYGLRPQIKWPNDVLLDGRKLCGILVEASWLGEQLQAVVLGIGINVLAAAVPPPEELLFPATSLETALGQAVLPETLLRDFLTAFFELRPSLAQARFLQEWESRLAYKGHLVTVENAGGPPVTGFVTGVDPGGNLRLRLMGDQEISLAAGDVRLRPAN